MVVWNKLEKDKIEERIMNLGYIIISNSLEDVCSETKLSVIDPNGYKYYASYQVIINANKRNCNMEAFSKQNIYSSDNISLWCKLNKKTFSFVEGDFSNSEKTLIFKCQNCEEEFDSSWNNIKAGKGCPFCRGLRVSRKNNLLVNFPEICLDWNYDKNKKSPEEYACGSSKNTYWKCHLCSFEWNTSISNRTSLNRGCPNCARLKSKGRPSARKKTHEKFIQEIYNVVGDEYSILSKYLGTDKDILIKHNICEHEWKVKPQSFLSGNRCPRCKFSKGEREIESFLLDNKIPNKSQMRFKDCKDKIPLPFDFYLPEHNLCIEYNGKHHYELIDFAGYGELWAKENFIKIQKRDTIKREYCNKNSIFLLIIPYWEFSNINKILTKTLL